METWIAFEGLLIVPTLLKRVLLFSWSHFHVTLSFLWKYMVFSGHFITDCLVPIASFSCSMESVPVSIRWNDQSEGSLNRKSIQLEPGRVFTSPLFWSTQFYNSASEGIPVWSWIVAFIYKFTGAKHWKLSIYFLDSLWNHLDDIGIFFWKSFWFFLFRVVEMGERPPIFSRSPWVFHLFSKGLKFRCFTMAQNGVDLRGKHFFRLIPRTRLTQTRGHDRWPVKHCSHESPINRRSIDDSNLGTPSAYPVVSTRSVAFPNRY